MSGKLKEVRERIKSVRNTQQITKAMKMVSAAKLRRAQQAIVEMRPYADRLNRMLRNILSNLEGDVRTSLGTERDVHSALVVVVTSSKGLCGAFNANVIKAARAKIDGDYGHLRKEGKVRILCIGKRGYDFFRKNYTDCTLINDYVDLVTSLTFESSAAVSELLMSEFEKSECDEVFVAYGRFKNAGTQFPECVQYLPVAKMEAKEGRGEHGRRADYIFEPDKQSLLDHLIPSILNTTFFRYLLDTHASEHGARMTAMDKATENAEELLNDLKINYNKARQEAITKEISEIVGGAAALGG